MSMSAPRALETWETDCEFARTFPIIGRRLKRKFGPGVLFWTLVGGPIYQPQASAGHFREHKLQSSPEIAEHSRSAVVLVFTGQAGAQRHINSNPLSFGIRMVFVDCQTRLHAISTQRFECL
jgi:hypothetical protein